MNDILTLQSPINDLSSTISHPQGVGGDILLGVGIC